MAGFKNGKIMLPIKEFLIVKGQATYELNTIDMTKVTVFYRKYNQEAFLETYSEMPKGDYRINEVGGNKQLEITNLDILDEYYSIQLARVVDLTSSPYNPSGQIDVITLNQHLNEVIADVTFLFTYLKDVGMVMDSSNGNKIMAKLKPYTTWYMDKDGNMAAMPVDSLFEKFNDLVQELRQEVLKLLEQDLEVAERELLEEVKRQLDEYVETDLKQRLDDYTTQLEERLQTMIDQAVADKGLMPEGSDWLEIGLGNWLVVDLFNKNYIHYPPQLNSSDNAGVVKKDITDGGNSQVIRYYTTTGKMVFAVRINEVWSEWQELGGQTDTMQFTQANHGFVFTAVTLDGATRKWVKANKYTSADGIAIKIDNDRFDVVTRGVVNIPTQARDDKGEPFVYDEYYFLSQEVDGGFSRTKNEIGTFQYLAHISEIDGKQVAYIDIGDSYDLDYEVVDTETADRVGIGTYKTTLRTADTIEDLKRLNLKEGDLVEVLGYYAKGDGANHKRKIESADDGSGIQLDNQLWANEIENSYGLNRINSANLTKIRGNSYSPNREYFYNMVKIPIANETDKQKDKLSNETINYRLPLIIDTGVNKLIFYTVMRGTDRDMGQVANAQMDIGYKISKDGINWSETKIACTKGSEWQLSEMSGIFNDRTNEIILLFTGCKGQLGWGYSEQGYDENTTAQIFMIKSKDFGETWEEPINITQQIKIENHYLTWTSPQQILLDKFGNLIAPIGSLLTKGGSSGNVCSGYTISYDNGKTWSKFHQVNRGNDTGGEIVFYEGIDGSYYCMDRTETSGATESLQKIYKSKDLVHWKFINSITTNRCKASVGRGFRKDNGFNINLDYIIAPSVHYRKTPALYDMQGNLIAIIENIPDTTFGYSSYFVGRSGVIWLVYETMSWNIQLISFDINKMLSKNIISSNHNKKMTLYNLTSNEYIDGELVDCNEGLYYKKDGKVYKIGFDTLEEITITEQTTSIEINDRTSIIWFDGNSNGSTIEKIVGGHLGQIITLITSGISKVINIKSKSTDASLTEKIIITPFKNNNTVVKAIFYPDVEDISVVDTTTLTLKKTKWGWHRI